MENILFLRAHDTKIQVNVSHPLGALFLAARVREAFPGQFNLRILHTGLYEDPGEILRHTLSEFPPDYAVITALTAEIPFMRSLIRIIKKAAPGCRVLIGGPYPTSMPDHAARQPDVDVAGVGEGEETLVELLRAFREHQPLDAVRGIAFARGDEVIRTPERPFLDDLDRMPLPAWDLIDLEPYRTVTNMSSSLRGRNYASLFTSRGCPFRCIYCHSIQGKRFRARSPQLVLEEMQWLYDEYAIDEFHLMDDIFNFDRERMHEICRRIIDSGMKVHLCFPNGIRTDMLQTEDIDILRQAGTYKFCFAIETRCERIQKAIRKNNNFRKIDPIISYTAKTSIIASSFFMIGFPTETRAEMEETIRYAVESDLDAALFFQVIPYPGTALHEWAQSQNASMADAFSFDPEDYHFSSGHCATTHLSHREVTYLILTAYLRFYLRPARLWRLRKKIKKLPDWLSFLHHLYDLTVLYLRFSLHLQPGRTIELLKGPEVN
jgi:radical SAM superfamily enzyme YgiQ (UPF0313 family)